MYCSNCGQKNDETKFCSNCGKQNFFKKYIYRGDKRFFLSSMAVILGFASIGSSISNHQPSMLEAGWAIIFGALAYKSAKKRKLSLVKSTKLRISLEIISVAISLLIIFTQSNIIILVVNDPFINLTIPLWVLLAYVVANLKKRLNTETKN